MNAVRPRAWRCLRGLLVVALVIACDARNPAQVSRERHPEYYAADRAQPVRRAEVPHPEPPPAAPPDFSELSGETLVVEPAPADEPGAPIDLAAARLSGALRIDVNDPVFPPRLDALFDGDTSTLSRSEDVNPLIFIFRFTAPITLSAVKVFPSYSTYDWALRPQPDQPRYLLRSVADSQWSRIDLPQPVETAEVRIELRRLERDNYVHVNELVLLAPGDR